MSFPYFSSPLQVIGRFLCSSLFLASSLSVLGVVSCQKKQEAQDVSVSKKEASSEVKPTVTQHAPIKNGEIDALFTSLKKLPGQDALSKQCKDCHKEIHAHWKASDHGQANRLMDPKQDDLPFSNKSFKDATAQWFFTKSKGQYQIKTGGKTYTPGMVIGITPLIQYLVADSGGRWQTASASWDPHKKEWFDVIDGDDRTPVDWGHWTGRGMTWNTQCAWCHMTEYRKNYDGKTDSYDSKWLEMGVGCTQCHGGIQKKPDPQTGCLIDIAKDRSIRKNDPQRVIDNCATCHSRRGEFDDKFHIGDLYGDHYQLQLPTTERLYYPDGQIKEEDYVWTSLRLSNMGHKGVNCLDCHDPHSTKLKFPLEHNTLCMSCHAAGTNGRIHDAPLIVPTEHSHHKEGSTGNSCVACHMTQTVYMGRDPRRDHGFHVPDPLMTKENGTPNACNKCHKGKGEDVDWAIKWIDTWYGEKLHTPERERQRARTRAMARAFRQDLDALEPMLEAYSKEQNPTWQATMLEVMRMWALDPRVQRLGRLGVHSDDPMVRASASHLLEFSPGNDPWLDPMMKDPVREVRMAATWAMRNRLSPSSKVYKEMMSTLEFGADQPISIMRLAELARLNNHLDDAEKWMKKAIEIDKTSAAGREAYAILLGQQGRPKEALEQLNEALKLAPDSPRFLYLKALTYAELKQLDKTEKLLKRVIELAPAYDSAYYNLALLLAQKKQLDKAIGLLRVAEKINPQEVKYPYARATLHYQKGEKMEAFEACRTVLGIDRNHRDARQLLRQIAAPGSKKP